MDIQNPFLRGLLTSQAAGERSTANQIGALSGLLSVQNQMQMAPIQQELAMLQLDRARQGPAPKWQVAERFNERTGQPEKVIVDLNNPMNVMPFGAQKTQPQQLVNVPVPGQPGVTQGMWMRPGESTGMSVGAPRLPEILNPQVQAAKTSIAQAGRPNISVNTERTFLGEVAKGTADQITMGTQQARSALGTINTVNQIRGALDSGQVIAGPTTTARVFLGQLGQVMGIGGADATETLTKTRQAIQGLAQLELDAAQQMKGQGQITEAERAIIRRAASGDIDGMTAPELRVLTDTLDKTARFKIQSNKSNVQKLQQNPNASPVTQFMDIEEPAPYVPQRRASDRRQVKRTGTTPDGRRVVEYTDGTIEAQ